MAFTEGEARNAVRHDFPLFLMDIAMGPSRVFP